MALESFQELPPLARWEFAPDTTEIPDDEYVDLEVIDLTAFYAHEDVQSPSLGEESIQEELVARAIKAFKTVGFLAVTGHGLTAEQLHHHFDLGKMFCDEVSEDEKRQLHCRHAEEGSWAGYKPRGYFKRPSGAADMQENYDFYPFTAIESRLPKVARPYLSDFRQFIEHNHYIILRKVLGIISLGLGMPVDTLWKLHHSNGNNNDGALQGGPDKEIKWSHSKDHLRYGMYHPPTEEDRGKAKNLWLPGHTDLGSVTFIYSQPVAGLQVLMPEGEWRYVRHYPNHIIVNLGDVMEFVTGGVLKALPHRVAEPPADQRHLRRLGLFYFVPFLPEVPLTPLDHPSLLSMGAKNIFQNYLDIGGKPLISAEWMVRRAKLVGTKRPEGKSEKGDAEDILQEIHFRYHA